MPRKYELFRLKQGIEDRKDFWRVVPADIADSFEAVGTYEHTTAIDARDVEPLVSAAQKLAALPPAARGRMWREVPVPVLAALIAALKAFEDEEGSK